ncbi:MULTISPECIES: ABC transporter ATP-binding protein [Lactobacillus]|uniref:ABC transporter ATP-binding protein n=1 Tax=Lactobacillus xujianguonis TaxID=2495899 RepID=A0A437SX81_9LACO|nr:MULTISPECIES: ABC transporter ATP-binding protein [Lactobacillus]RVU71543.1 ABC transporter ATP-binding protein [Lactobacillus xujianguonis]RVU76730.1 ABC transporter ATP-binding protein [Lactobacillus xujianguonis]
MKTYILKSRYKFIFLIFLLVMVAALQVYSAVVMANIINAIVAHHLNVFCQQMLLWFLIWVVIAGIRFSLSILETNFEQGIANNIRNDLVETIANESYEKYNSQDGTKFVSWMNNDLQQVVDKGITYLYVVTESISSIVLSLITLWNYNLWIMLISIVLAAITLYLPSILNRRLAKTSAALSRQNEGFVRVASDLLNSFNMLFSFNALSLMKKKINQEAGKLKAAYVSQAKVYGGIAVLGFLSNIISQISLTGLTGLLVYKGMLGIGVIYSVSNLTGNIFNGVGNLPNYLSYIKSTEPIFAKFEKFIAENASSNSNSQALTVAEPFLAMKDVEFKYPNTQNIVIKDFSYNFEQNKKYLLDGDSGCGKSTILKLLAGYYPSYNGKILFEGHDLNEYAPQQLHENIFYLDQHPQVIQGTVRDNLELIDDFTEQQLKQVLKQVYLDDSDEFLNTNVEKGGSSLSGGQLQRLALARALLRKSKVFLLDEGTTGIETKTAIELEQLLLKDPNKTVIVVNHGEAEENMKLFDHVINLSK